MSSRQTSTVKTRKGPPRWEGFDHLRGLAAIAVVALHGAYAYSYDPLAGLIWCVPLDEPNHVADALFWATEGCVMPIFFLMSGFFLAQSLCRKNPEQVLASRSRRLLLPLLVLGAPVLFVDLSIWGFGLVQMDRVTMTEYLRIDYPDEIKADLIGPAHLWYIEYLWIMIAGICVVWWLAGRIRQLRSHDHTAEAQVGVGVQPSGCSDPAYRLKPELQRPAQPTLPFSKGGPGFRSIHLAGFVTLIGAITAILAFEPAVVIGFQHSWLPAGPKFFHGLAFVLLGMLLQNAEGLLVGLRRTAPFLLAGAAGTFCFLLPMSHQALATGDGTAFDLTLGLVLSGFALLATGGAVGGCLRWLGQPNHLLGELGAASFWVYIVHHPILGAIQLSLHSVAIPSIAKFLITFGGTLTICLVSWHVLVRDGAIGQVLAGRWPGTWAWPARRPEPVILEPAAQTSVEVAVDDRSRRAA